MATVPVRRASSSVGSPWATIPVKIIGSGMEHLLQREISTGHSSQEESSTVQALHGSQLL